MSYKKFQRVIYKNKPLAEVVCQLRFPRILKINEMQPADFQEYIRHDFPSYQVNVERQQQITADNSRYGY